jgi:hypothetical protein
MVALRYEESTFSVHDGVESALVCGVISPKTLLTSLQCLSLIVYVSSAFGLMERLAKVFEQSHMSWSGYIFHS